MREKISILQAQIQTTRRVVELCKQRQRVEEEKEEMMRNARGYLLAQAERIESKPGRTLVKRQQSISDIIETLEKERKTIDFWNDLNNSAHDLGKVADTWKPGKLRRVRALNDLSTSREEFFDVEFATCDLPGDLSDDNAFWNDLNNSAHDLGKVADTWKPGKLRRVRALNDLSTSREEFFDDEFAPCDLPGYFSDDDALTEVLRHEKFEGSLSITEPSF
ncbi:uncharacterized protein LOC111333510 [Stylophora pistillata]|uniref:Uncharacterized protein n=1 Tax=Stylophora pistillata TaxID=50429 RepID=A0A2B4S0U6_STYPI|nr:uncharacterized protein LOC111333510 [Stylophora pistillata]PFX23036.1 hypothetical protein AWC38_SpisGene12449 [Stylophora pistillata]